jgi:hypothetical protein
MQAVCQAFCLALLKAGSNNAAKMAIMAITTKSSIKVKPSAHGRCFVAARFFMIRIKLKFGQSGSRPHLARGELAMLLGTLFSFATRLQ